MVSCKSMEIPEAALKLPPLGRSQRLKVKALTHLRLHSNPQKRKQPLFFNRPLKLLPGMLLSTCSTKTYTAKSRQGAADHTLFCSGARAPAPPWWEFPGHQTCPGLSAATLPAESWVKALLRLQTMGWRGELEGGCKGKKNSKAG